MTRSEAIQNIIDTYMVFASDRCCNDKERVDVAIELAQSLNALGVKSNEIKFLIPDQVKELISDTR